MSDARLRELERRAQASGSQEDAVVVMRERVRVGALTGDQILMAAYLSDPTARAYHADGLYDTTGKINDHIVGVCPCGDCLWGEGVMGWINNLVGGHAENLPFPGIDGPHARQETLIRMGRALAASVWEKLYTPEAPFGAYVLADLRAGNFLDLRNAEARAACRELWDDPEWGAPDWAHQVLYHIVANPEGHTDNIRHWFFESGSLMADPCEHCGNRVTAEQIQEHGIHEALVDLAINCEHCQGSGEKHVALAREVVERALVPWVLTTSG